METDPVVEASIPTVNVLLRRLVEKFGTLVIVPVERKVGDTIESHQRRFCSRLSALQDERVPPSCAFVGGPFLYKFDGDADVSLIACLGIPKLRTLFYVRGESIAASGLSSMDVCAAIDVVPDKQPNPRAVAALRAKRTKPEKRKV